MKKCSRWSPITLFSTDRSITITPPEPTNRTPLRKLNVLFHDHHVVVAVGGSGLYMDALTKGLSEFPKVSPGVRLKLDQQFRKYGIEGLQEELLNVDPEYHAEVDLKNPARLIRALEITRETGKPYSEYRRQKPQKTALQKHWDCPQS